ncbi:MAG TPA: DUF1614 domain-containing protein [Nitrospirales bacterium]|nr:DUF1614 domain-containing protein [Nitrospirales bacterium]
MNGRLGCLPIFLFLLLLFLLPLVFAQFMGLALVKLRLDPSVAMLVIVGIFLGSVVNIPITRIARQDEVIAHPYPLFGFMNIGSHLQRSPRETILAVNLGGCVVPTLSAGEAGRGDRYRHAGIGALAGGSADSATPCPRRSAIGGLMSPGCSVPSWALISCTYGRSRASPPGWPASGEPAPLTALSSRESWPHIWRNPMKKLV